MGEAAKKPDDEKLIPVGPGAEDLADARAKEKDKDAEDEDERERGDERLGHAEEGDGADDKEERPERQKETSRERRERLKRKRTREVAELNFYRIRNAELEKLQSRVGAVESRTAQSEGAALDQRLNTIAGQIASTDRIVAEAIKKANGDDAAEALRIRDALRDEQNKINWLKQQGAQRERARAEAAQQAPAQQMSPQAMAHAQAWMAENEWFNANPRDREETLAIDNDLVEEGFRPESPEYWEELDRRAKERLPHRYKANGRANREADDDEGEEMDDEPERKPARRAASGPKFSSGGRERPLRKGEVYISKERKDAMIQAGLWEDPVARNRMLKRYADMDAEVASERTAQGWR